MDSLKGIIRITGDLIPDFLKGVIRFPGYPGIDSSRKFHCNSAGGGGGNDEVCQVNTYNKN